MADTDFEQIVLDVTTLRVLWRKWVSYDGPTDPLRLQAVIKRETAAAEAGRIPVSRGLLREMRHERALIGRIVKSVTPPSHEGGSRVNQPWS